MTSATAPKTILLNDGAVICKEALAAAAITPGMLIARTAGANTVGPHGVASGGAALLFAVENSMIGGTIGDEYEAADQVYFAAVAPGTEVYGLLAVAETATLNVELVSAGDGTFAVLDQTTGGNVVAIAREAVDNSAGTDPARIIVETVAPYYVAANPSA